MSRKTIPPKFSQDENITIFQLSRYIHLKLNSMTNALHVLSVINIIIDEIYQDLVDGKSLKIFNFGQLFLKRILGRRGINNLYTGDERIGKDVNILKFELDKKMREQLLLMVDKKKSGLE